MHEIHERYDLVYTGTREECFVMAARLMSHGIKIERGATAGQDYVAAFETGRRRKRSRLVIVEERL